MEFFLDISPNMFILQLINTLKLISCKFHRDASRCVSLIIDEDECGEEAQEGETGQHRHGVRHEGVGSRQRRVHSTI